MVVSIWSSCLQQCVLGCMEQGQPLPPEAPRELPVGQLQLAEVVEMLQACVTWMWSVAVVMKHDVLRACNANEPCERAVTCIMP
jgi:hypothetical protein